MTRERSLLLSPLQLDGKFLGMQLIYGGKTDQSLPRFKFPQNFSLSVNKKHYSNEQESLKLIDEIIVPYVNKERNRMQRPDQKALVIFDVFRGQVTDKVLKKFKENHIETVFVPANMTALFQPLDLTVNAYAKKFLKKKFNNWYMSEISNQLDAGKQIEEIEVKLQLTKLKPLNAEWLTDLYNNMTKPECKEVIMNGWKAAGILEAIEGGVSKLCLDPFSDLDPLLPQVPDDEITFDIIQEEEKQAFLDEREDSADESDEDEIYLPQGDNRNIFNLFYSIEEED